MEIDEDLDLEGIEVQYKRFDVTLQHSNQNEPEDASSISADDEPEQDNEKNRVKKIKTEHKKALEDLRNEQNQEIQKDQVPTTPPSAKAASNNQLKKDSNFYCSRQTYTVILCLQRRKH